MRSPRLRYHKKDSIVSPGQQQSCFEAKLCSLTTKRPSRLPDPKIFCIWRNFRVTGGFAGVFASLVLLGDLLTIQKLGRLLQGCPIRRQVRKCTSLVLFSVLLAPPLFADAGEHIIPA